MGKCGSRRRKDPWLLSLLCLRREDPKQRDDEVHTQIGLEVIVRLAAADRAHGRGIERGRRQIRPIRENRRARGSSQQVALRRVTGRNVGRSQQRVGVRGDLRDSQCDRLYTASLGEREAVPKVERYAPTEVRQRKGALAIAAISRADEIEQRLILGDG